MQQLVQNRERMAAAGLTFPIKLRCASITHLCVDAGLETALARALGRAFSHARRTLPASVAFGSGVALQLPYLTDKAASGNQATSLLPAIQRAISAAARAQALPMASAADFGADNKIRRGSESAERFELGRFIPTSGIYGLSSHQGGRKPLAIKPAADAAPSDDGLHIGEAGKFWQALRSMLFIRVENGQGIPERNDAIKILLQGIRREAAQQLIREALDRSYSGVRLEIIDALGKIKHDRAIAWKLLLYGLERPGDLLGHGPFERQLDTDPDPLIAYLESELKDGDEPYKSNAARVVRRYLEGEFDAKNKRRLRTYGLLRTLAARYGLYAAGPLGAGATRDRVEQLIDLLIQTLPAITEPLTPAAPRETPNTDDAHTLDPLLDTLNSLKKAIATMPPDVLAPLETRLTGALEMAFVLPDRLADIQTSIRGIDKKLGDDSIPSDEITVFQKLRRRYLVALLNAPASDKAIDEFNNAEFIFADFRIPVANEKLSRLWREFGKARDAVDTGSGLPLLSKPPDPSFGIMKEVLGHYTQALVDSLMPIDRRGAAVSWTVEPIATSLESANQIETDFIYYKILGAMFLFYGAALRYDQDKDDVGGEEWRSTIAWKARMVRSNILDFWNRQDYSGFLNVAASLRVLLDRIGSDIEDQRKADRNARTAILLAAMLVTGVVGILAEGALVGLMLEATAGARNLAILVTVTEATAFTATKIGLEHATFGTPVTLSGAAHEWVSNLAQFAAFGVLSRVMAPMGAAGKTWLAFAGKHAAGLALQVDIASISLLAEGRGFPPDVGNFLVETFGAYAIGATTSHIGGRIKNEAIVARSNEVRLKGEDILRRANEALRTGTLDEPAFNRLKHDMLAWLARVESVNDFMHDSKVMTDDEHAASLKVIDRLTDQIGNAKFQAGRPYSGPLLLEAGKIPGLVKVGSAENYRYDPRRPPAQLQEIANSYRRIGSVSTTFEHGTITVRRLGSQRLVLLIGPGPIPAGLLTAGPAAKPAPHSLTFIERAAGGQLTAAGIESTTALLQGINRNTITELQPRGEAGLAATSLLIKHRLAIRSWPIAAVRGLATAFELPRQITRASLERFFSLPSDDTAGIFVNFQAIADMPGANLIFSDPSTQNAVQLVGLYRELKANNLMLPEGMTAGAQRGMRAMLLSLGHDATLARIRALPVDHRLAEFVGNDPMKERPPALAPRALLTARGDPTPAGLAFIRKRFGEKLIKTEMNPRRVSDLNDGELSQQLSHEWKWLEDMSRAEVAGEWEQMRQSADERGIPFDPRLDFVLLEGSAFNTFAPQLQAAARVSGHTVSTAVLGEVTGSFIDTLLQQNDPVVRPAYDRAEKAANEARERRKSEPPTRVRRAEDFADRWSEFLRIFRRGTNGTKKPDLLEVLLSRNQIIISDPSLAYADPSHNFKLAVYNAIMQRLINVQVGAADVRSLFRQTLVGP